MNQLFSVAVPRQCKSVMQSQGVVQSYISLSASRLLRANRDSIHCQIRHGTSINVVLLDNLVNKGIKGDVVSVKRGFARNVLIPSKIAAYGTYENIEKHQAIILHRKYLEDSGIVPKGYKNRSVGTKVVAKKAIAESDVIEFVKATVNGGEGTVIENVTIQEIQTYLKECGFIVPSEGEIIMPSVVATGLYPITIGGVKAILNIIPKFEIKQDKRLPHMGDLRQSK